MSSRGLYHKVKMMDEFEDVEETIERLQREWLLANSGGDDLDSEEPFKPSYSYGCARTAGVAVCRWPPPNRQRQMGGSASRKGTRIVMQI